ncbi:uncharacterized protein METZ01_LOCUS223979, partial [marine metagenome]
MKAKHLRTTQYGAHVMWVFDVIQKQKTAVGKELVLWSVGIQRSFQDHPLMLGGLGELNETAFFH